MYRLAILHRDYGNDEERSQVIPLLERSVLVKEKQRALFHLAKTLVYDTGNARDPVRAAQLLRRALRRGRDSDCLAALGKIVLTEPSVKGDTTEGLALYKEAMHLSSHTSYLNSLGWMYTTGAHRLERSYSRAVSLFKMAIERGSVTAVLNFADLLDKQGSQFGEDHSFVISKLEEQLNISDNRVMSSLSRLVRIYGQWEAVRDYNRVFELCERGVKQYRSSRALIQWVQLLLLGHDGLPVNLNKAMAVCNRYTTFGPFPSVVLSSILWTGTEEVPANPHRALLICRQLRNAKPFLLASMFRYGASKFPSDRGRAKSICMNPVSDEEKLINAVLLSEEEDSESIRKAEKRFRKLKRKNEGSLVWVPLYIRRSNFSLPFHGDPKRLRCIAMKFEYLCHVASLNLAMLLLERKKRKSESRAEALTILNSLLETRLKEVAQINLAYIFWNGIAGFEQNRKRARKVLEADEGGRVAELFKDFLGD
ncbi:hypothetical protein FGB62_7g10 [Gracilaria domingensis]|nr:hypothetical protein FGB62_7g10 [Gracilaria domingensis]